MQAVGTIEMKAGRGPNVRGSSSSHRGEDPVPAIEKVEMPLGRGTDMCSSLRDRCRQFSE